MEKNARGLFFDSFLTAAAFYVIFLYNKEFLLFSGVKGGI